MNKNLGILTEKLLSDKELCEQFIKLNSIDEIYEFCTLIVEGYSKEEFDEFAAAMLEYSDSTLYSESLSESKLENISGGLKPGIKVASLALAALTTASGVGIVSASPAANVAKATVNAQITEKVPSKSTWQKVKEFCIKHKRILIAGGIATSLLGGIGVYAIYKTNKNKKNTNSTVKNPNSKPGEVPNKTDPSSTNGSKIPYKKSPMDQKREHEKEIYNTLSDMGHVKPGSKEENLILESFRSLPEVNTQTLIEGLGRQDGLLSSNKPNPIKIKKVGEGLLTPAETQDPIQFLRQSNDDILKNIDCAYIKGIKYEKISKDPLQAAQLRGTLNEIRKILVISTLSPYVGNSVVKAFK